MLFVILAGLGFAPLSLRARSATPRMSADIITGWQPGAVASLCEALALQQKGYTAELGFDEFSLGGAAGAVNGFEAPGKNNVAWVSALSLSDGAGSARASVTAFVGPLSDVPHLVASSSVRDGGIDLLIDFRPRADSGFLPDTREEDMPEPDTREAFAMGGNRKDYRAAFFTEECVAWRDALLAIDGAVHTPLTAEETAAQSAGPIYTSLRLPLNDGAAQAAAKACEEATARWLSWMQSSAEQGRDLPAGAKQTQVYGAPPPHPRPSPPRRTPHPPRSSQRATRSCGPRSLACCSIGTKRLTASRTGSVSPAPTRAHWTRRMSAELLEPGELGACM